MFLAAWLPALMGALAGVMASLVGRVVLSLGIGFVIYSGISIAFLAMQTAAINELKGIGGDVAALIGYLWIDRAISVMFSAVLVSLSMRGLGSSVKKMIFN